jgi:hypothetical protein
MTPEARSVTSTALMAKVGWGLMTQLSMRKLWLVPLTRMAVPTTLSIPKPVMRNGRSVTLST